ncbi:M20 metallopeptidase family protein, partial [Glutamicibacter halophytocola]|uniref:M20 metallopeptidase family protein n=1 Tax=Glutamicibacter halophytocola TaxID=1933880 RepID=UPI0015C53B41
FMFQPGEEGHGGAKIMLEEGLLSAAGEPPVAAYAIHVGPGPRGVFATRGGPVAAGSNQLTVKLKGRGGHGSQPHQTLDPVPAAAELVLALQSFVTRRFNAFDPVVLSITRLSTGDGAINVIPESVELAATIRTMSHDSLAVLEEGLPRVVHGVAAAHELTADVCFETLYPVTVNDAAETEAALETMREIYGEQRVALMPSPMMGSEDFAFVLDEVPGTFIGLLTSPPELPAEETEWNHSPRVVFDDSVLADQAAALAAIAFKRTAR